MRGSVLNSNIADSVALETVVSRRSPRSSASSRPGAPRRPSPRVLRAAPRSSPSRARCGRCPPGTGPRFQECDLVEPAPLASARVTHDGAAALPSAQPTVWLPLELDRIRTAVTFDGATVVRAKGFSHRRPDVVVVIANQEPAHPLKALDQVGGQRAEDVWRVGHRGL